MLDHIPIGSEDKNLDSIFVGSGAGRGAGGREHYSTYHNDHGRCGDYLSYLTRGRSKKAEAFSVWSQGMELEPVGGNDRETDLYPLQENLLAELWGWSGQPQKAAACPSDWRVKWDERPVPGIAADGS